MLKFATPIVCLLAVLGALQSARGATFNQVGGTATYNDASYTGGSVSGGGTANFNGSAYLSGTVTLADTSVANVSGAIGSSPSTPVYIDQITATNSSQVNMTGGKVQFINFYNNASLTVTAGTVGSGTFFEYMQGSSRLTVSNTGKIDSFLVASDTSSVALNGDSVNSYISYVRLTDSATFTMRGGLIPGYFQLRNNSTAVFALDTPTSYSIPSGSGVTVVGNQVFGTGNFTVNLIDNPFAITFYLDENHTETGARLLLVPEPASLCLIALSGAAMTLRRRKLDR